MAGRQALSKRLREYMQLADTYIDSIASSEASISLAHGKRLIPALEALSKALDRVGIKQWASELHDETAASKTLWLEACSDAGIAQWLLQRVSSIPGQIAALGDYSTVSRRLFDAYDACCVSCQQIHVLLNQWTLPLITMDCGRDWGRFGSLITPMLDVKLLTALAQAARCAADHARSMGLPASQAALRDRGVVKHELIPEYAARACADLTRSASRVMCVLGKALPGLASASAAKPVAFAMHLSTHITQITAALHDSQFLAAAAYSIMTYPGPNFHPTLGQRPGGAKAAAKREEKKKEDKTYMAPYEACEALYFLTMDAAVNLRAIKGGAAAATSAADALDEALSRPDVCRLRLALLESVWVHAGMEPTPGEGPGDGVGGSSSGGSSGSIGGSSSGGSSLGGAGEAEGAWQRRLEWVTCTARDSHGSVEASSTSGWLLENHHLQALMGALCPWARKGKRLLCPPGVPPTLHRARLAARTAEALCRLSRGQGRDGTYRPAPNWLFAQKLRGHVICNALLPSKQDVSAAPAAGASALWGEAAAWAVALHTDAVKAQAEGCWTGSGGHGSIPPTVVPGTALSESYKWFADLGEASQDTGAVLNATGLGASMEQGLRLAFCANDVATATGARQLSVKLAILEVFRALVMWDLPLVITTTEGAEPSLSEAGGVMVTLAKRAAAEAGRLEAQAAAGQERIARGLAFLQFKSSTANISRVLALALACTCEQRLASFGDGDDSAAASAEGAASSELAGSCSPPAAAGGSSVAAELEGFALRSICRLALQEAEAITSLTSLTAGLGLDKSEPTLSFSIREVVQNNLSECLGHFTTAHFQPGFLTAGQILACQPHRLLAAACKLQAASRAAGDEHQPECERPTQLACSALESLASLAAHPELSARVRAWLVPEGEELHPTAQAALEAAGAEDSGERGCLAELIGTCLLPTGSFLDQTYGDVLLKAALGREYVPSWFFAVLLNKAIAGAYPPEEGRDEQDGGFRRHAEHIATCITLRDDGEYQGLSLMPPLADRFAADPALEATLLAAPLPLPLAVPPAALVLTKLRVCGNPGCNNFDGPCEASLKLKQCGGCKAVRYCGRECQTVHWRSGHKGECGAMAAAVQAEAGKSGAA
ncbi:hypothetical protein HYH03_008992 [Edaphochlamys debaryana]|uniref:MYND-type domain-containing protein n=1 Tax=Edaphochlamys debaryana TaxID=47281 RepID=A0A836BYZ3_9CHLO|nr:hypothetical protein HYH03_008992 [Edaphochlamys debaryana]|eukprot:KAG2492838.1 hypothetical protein HYH03_008992 [Edaphochlamys debaryana]